MLTIESRLFVVRMSGREVTDFLLDCTDDRYQQWWPGVHLQLHALARGRDHLGDIVLADEHVGKRRADPRPAVPALFFRRVCGRDG